MQGRVLIKILRIPVSTYGYKQPRYVGVASDGRQVEGGPQDG